jgi:hypothetical protein
MARMLWSYTTEDAEEALGRKLAPGEAQRIEKSIGHSSVGSVIAGVIDMFRGPDDWPGDEDDDYSESLAKEDARNAWQHDGDPEYDTGSLAKEDRRNAHT